MTAGQKKQEAVDQVPEKRRKKWVNISVRMGSVAKQG